MTRDVGDLVWIDLEMTGLDPVRDRIIEVATVVTDVALRVIAEGPVLAVYQPEDVLSAIDFLSAHVPPGRSPMCGNSVCQDRRFLARWMPALERHFHYRAVDVSTLKELALRWRPELAAALTKQSSHRAADDIRESIRELAFYRDHFLRLS